MGNSNKSKATNQSMNEATSIEDCNARIQKLRLCVVQLEKRETLMDQKITTLSNEAAERLKQNDGNGCKHKLQMKECFEKERETIQEQKYEYELKIMETEDALLNKQTMTAIKSSTAAMDGVMGDAKEEKQLSDDFERATGDFNDKYEKEMKNINDDLHGVISNLEQQQDNITSQVNEALYVVQFVNEQIKDLRANEDLLLERYKMYKYAAKNMKDKGDKVSAVQYLRQSKLIAKQIETVRQKKVVLTQDVPPPIDDEIWKTNQ
eukprot:42522_1